MLIALPLKTIRDRLLLFLADLAELAKLTLMLFALTILAAVTYSHFTFKSSFSNIPMLSIAIKFAKKMTLKRKKVCHTI